MPRPQTPGTLTDVRVRAVDLRRAPPAPGQQTDEILREAGYDDQKITRLRPAGVVR
jgi:crotonobetainyl-CoA:carnitine CoA-transferase CaiB-like acyl-CoA transferase